jgi:hypothetical protein
MKQQEFLQLIDQYGINLNALSITVGEVSGWEGAHGVYFKNNKWFYYSADGRNHIDESPLDSEDEAFDKLLKDVFMDLNTKRYLTKSIDEEIVKIGKEKICSFIRDTYSMSERRANDTWAYLKQDMHVLFEVKYYVAHGEFVPAKHCYKVQGYSAEQLYTTTCLEVIGAFNYLIYLKTKPQEALANLNKGLPRRTIYTNQDFL